MRESIGGAWLFGIVAVFIFFFAAFLTYSINYTRAFNLKNEIINKIEKSQGYEAFGPGSVTDVNNPDLLENNVEGEIYSMIKSMGYNSDATVGIKCEGKNNKIRDGGYCLVKVCPDNNNPTSNTHYKVTTYIALNLPVVNINVNIPITGETRTLYKDAYTYECTELAH
jgi:hypothetical protein